MYGGAFAIVLFIAVIIWLIVLMIKANRMVNTGTQAIKTVTNSLMMPLLSVMTVITPLLRKTTRTKTAKTTKKTTE